MKMKSAFDQENRGIYFWEHIQMEERWWEEEEEDTAKEEEDRVKEEEETDEGAAPTIQRGSLVGEFDKAHVVFPHQLASLVPPLLPIVLQFIPVLGGRHDGLDIWNMR